MSNTKIESVIARQRGAYDFESHYNDLCTLQNVCPIPAVKARLQENVLDLNGDRIRCVNMNTVYCGLNSIGITNISIYYIISGILESYHKQCIIITFLNYYVKQID